MNPFKFAAAIYVLVGSVIPLVSSLVIPGASIPLFYLVISSENASTNLLNLQITGNASAGYSTQLTGGVIGQFYFYQGSLIALDSTNDFNTAPAMIAKDNLQSGCTTYGPLVFKFSSNSSGECTDTNNTFALESDDENSQLGASLTLNFVGGFYACGSSQDVWYKVDAEDGPTGCSAIDLFTVPVLPIQ